MKTLIICFSQTGNTHKVAECIRHGIVQETGQCDLMNMSEVDPRSLADYDLVGLGCPVFYYKEPFNVRDFINALPELKGKHWFIFCTHGSVMGKTLISMLERLKEKGIIVVGHHHTYADGTLPFYPYPTLTTGHPDPTDCEEARAFGREIAGRSRGFAEGEKEFIAPPDPLPEEWALDAEMLTLEFMNDVMPRLHIDMDKCILCHECEDNCPVKGINIEDDPPRIQAPCIYCWYCTKICPTLAIYADWDNLVAMAPEQYARYRKALEDAATRGEFRWLIDPDSLDFDMPLYKQREREIESEEKGTKGDLT
jgi:flavodoxin/ferredoxin